MKRYLKTIIGITALLIVVGVAVVPSVSWGATNILEGARDIVINGILSTLSYALLTVTAKFVTIAGIFLSISINLTTHIGSFFDSIPALKDIWVVVRNISSIFIIFGLLYVSILKILSIDKSSLGNPSGLIKNIVIAGLLINFSLFFVKVGIDASNLISLQFYNAIAPGTSENFSTDKVFNDGGLSNVFLTSLQLPKIYGDKGFIKDVDISASMFFATVGGMLMMITAAISLFAAAIAFIARTGILLFVMALSPLYFVAMIFPQLKKEADKLFELFKNQLLFMPAYLFFMYVALKLISSPGFKNIFNQDAVGVSSALTGNSFGPTFIGIIIQYIIALFFINLPLVMAISFGARGAKWAPDVKTISKTIGNFAGRNTYGRVASRVARSETFQNIAAKDPTMISEFALKKTRSVATNYDKKLTERTQARENFAKSLDRNKTAAANYAERISKSIPSKLSVFGTIGRADRVAAAKILRTRLADQETELNKLNKELKIYQDILNRPGGALNSYQQERHDKLTGTVHPVHNPLGTNEITEQIATRDDTKNQLSSFERRVDPSGNTKAKEVEKRNY